MAMSKAGSRDDTAGTLQAPYGWNVIGPIERS